MRHAVLVAAVLSGLALVARVEASDTCSRVHEAIVLANEGDTLRKSDLDSAIARYEEASAKDPANHRILHKLATAYMRKEAWPSMDLVLDRAERLAPRHAGYRFLRGLALARTGAWDAARDELSLAVQIDPNLTDAHHELAEVYLHLRDDPRRYRKAAEHYTRAIETRPDDATLYLPLGDLYLRLGHLAESKQVLLAGVARVQDEPRRWPYFTLLGEVAEGQRDFSASTVRFEQARVACGPCNEGGAQITYYNLGMAYARATPPRRSEAVVQLQSFMKTTCRSAAAARYVEACTLTAETLTALAKQP